MLKINCLAVSFTAAALSTIVLTGSPVLAQDGVSPSDALKRLEEGQARYVEGKAERPRSGADRRTEVAKGQKPFAAVLSCADSRVPVETIFDQGIGDLFVVRVAGNVCESSEAGSIEFGATALGANLIVVMGHTSCGAVVAASSGKPIPGAIGEVIKDIAPAVERTKKADPAATGDTLVAKAIRANVMLSIERLIASSEALQTRVADGGLQIVGAVYNIETGRVEWLGQHPDQAKLLADAKSANANRDAKHNDAKTPEKKPEQPAAKP